MTKIRSLLILLILSAGLNTFGQSLPRVMLFFAHPDDEFMMRATLARFQELGFQVGAIYVTAGEGGRRVVSDGNHWSLTEVDHEWLKATRIKEMRETAKRLGIHPLLILEEPDLPFRDPVTKIPSRDGSAFLERSIWNVPRIESATREFVRFFKPDLIFTMSLDGDTHAHHKAVRYIVDRMQFNGDFGNHVEAIYAVDENSPFQQFRENRPYELAFDPTAPMLSGVESYAVRGTRATSAHESQLVGHELPSRTPERFYTIHGSSRILEAAIDVHQCAAAFGVQHLMAQTAK